MTIFKFKQFVPLQATGLSDEHSLTGEVRRNNSIDEFSA